MGYAVECHKRRAEDEAYKIYMTDAIGALCGTTARYIDIIRPHGDYDAQQVCERVIQEAGLEVMG